jgi:hypothetical protein
LIRRLKHSSAVLPGNTSTQLLMRKSTSISKLGELTLHLAHEPT